MTPYTQTDFSGGITDNYLSCAPNCYYKADNLSIDVNGKLYTRPGTKAYPARVPIITFLSGNTRVSGIYIGNEPFGNPVVCRGDSLYFALNDAWTTITGPGGTAALINKSSLDVESAVIWRKQLILCSSCSSTSLSKTGTVAPTYAITQGGVTIYQDNQITVTNATGILVGQVVLGIGIPSNTVVTGVSSLVVTVSQMCTAGANLSLIFNAFNVMPTRVYCTTLNATYQAVTLGLPLVAGTGISYTPGPGGDYTYAYAFYYSYTFVDYEGTVFEDRGPVFLYPTQPNLSVAIGGGGTVAFTAIPVLANSASSNYDLTNVKINICRTISNGQNYYIVATISNGTTTYSDTTTDATLLASRQLYTNGNVLNFEQPPISAKYVTVVNDIFWWASDTVVTQSNAGAPGGCPSSFYQPMQQKIRGLSDVISFPVLFCDRSVYRIDGQFDELGIGGFQLYEISQTAGCISNRSIVKIPGGLVWFGNGGIYFTDGYSVKKISYGLDIRYQLWNSPFVAGAYDSTKNQVVWSVGSSAGTVTFPTDSFITLHLRYGITETSVFTTWSSMGNIYPTSLAFSGSVDISSTYRSKLLIGEARGYLLYQDQNALTDPKIDITLFPTSFQHKAIIHRFESSALDLGTDALRKYCVDLTAELENETNIAIQFLSRRDDGGAWGNFSEIRSDIPPTTNTPGGSGSIIWDVSEYAWDDPNDLLTHGWDSQPLVEGRRFFPAGTLRSTRRQIGFTNSYTFIAISDVLGLASILSAHTLTLNAGSWPHYVEGYYIGIDPLATGTYTYYQIKERVSDTTISVYDPLITFPTVFPTSNLKWQMQGYRKFERAKLLSYTVNFDQGSNTQNPSKGNAGLINA